MTTIGFIRWSISTCRSSFTRSVQAACRWYPKALVQDAVLQFPYDYEYAAGCDPDAQIMRASSEKQVS